MKARERILARVRQALSGVPEAALPPVPASSLEDPVGVFAQRLEASGARLVRVRDLTEAEAWLAAFVKDVPRVWCSPRLPEALACAGGAAPEEAEVAVSHALAAAAETGSVFLPASEGRRGQLLAPVHVVVLEEDRLFSTLLEALRAVKDLDEAAIGLHAGPSKSADIGQIMVKGVHGPGALWVVLVGQGLDWDRVQALEGTVLTTKTGKPFRVLEVTDQAVVIQPASGKQTYKVSRANLERAAALALGGAELSGPAAYKTQVADEAPAYAWALLHALGYV